MQVRFHGVDYEFPFGGIGIGDVLDCGDASQNDQCQNQTIFHGGRTAVIPQYLRKE